jgi:hypothetical protein
MTGYARIYDDYISCEASSKQYGIVCKNGANLQRGTNPKRWDELIEEIKRADGARTP